MKKLVAMQQVQLAVVLVDETAFQMHRVGAFKQDLDRCNLPKIRLLAEFCNSHVRDNFIEGICVGIIIPKMHVKALEALLQLRAYELLTMQPLLVRGLGRKNESTTDLPTQVAATRGPANPEGGRL